MTGLGTLINCAGIVLGGLVGTLFGKLFKKEAQDSITKACGVSTMFIGISGALSVMLKAEGNTLSTRGSMLVVLCIALGTMIGELLHIEDGFEHFGEWLKQKTGNAGDKGFVNAFVTASLTVCIGAMAIVGAIQDGLSGDISTLAVKTVLDLIFVAVMSSSLGKGCVFSAIPVFLLQFSVTLLAKLISPILTAEAITSLSMVGSVLIFCVGVNLVWEKKFRVANMLPAVILAVAAVFLPIQFL